MMTLPPTLHPILALALAAAVSRPALAQLAPSFTLGTSAMRPASLPPTGHLAFASTLRLDRPLARWEASALALSGDGEGARWSGTLSATVATLEHRGFRLEGDAHLRRSDVPGLTRALHEAALAARASYGRGPVGAWAGVSVAGVRGAAAGPALGGGQVGAWLQRGSLVVSASLDGERFGGSTVAPAGGTLDAEASARWLRGAAALQVAVGRRLRSALDRGAVWGRAEGTLQLSRQVALMAAAGVTPADQARGTPRTPHAFLGFRLAGVGAMRPALARGVRPVPSSFDLIPEGPKRQQIRLRVPGARSVEVAGDFTGWRAVSLTPVSQDEWEVTLAIPAGVQRINVRVDGGAWQAPPGIDTVADEFDGRVGLLVIE
jgi:hypothetical protein